MEEIQKFYNEDIDESRRLSSQSGHIENSMLFYSTTPEMIEEDLKKYNLKLQSEADLKRFRQAYGLREIKKIY